MTETSNTEAKNRSRLRWVTLGEAIAIAALILSGLGLWHEWNKRDEGPEVVVEKPTAIPLVLRGRERNEGRKLELSPIEDSHALQSLTVVIGKSAIELGSDGDLEAEDVQDALGRDWADDEGTHRVPVRITATYVEAGADKTATGSYAISYRVKDKLIGGRSLRLVGLSR